MASGPITSWQIDGETMEIVTDFIFLGSKITADADCSHEIKRFLLLGKSYNKPRQYVKKQKHHFANKGLYSPSCVFFFPVVMYECKSWTLKKAEHSRIDAFELWCWLRLESPFNSKEIKPVNPKKAINPEYSLERLMLKLKLQYFGYLMQRTEKSSWKRKDPDAGKD